MKLNTSLVKIIKSYLSDRYFKVKIGNMFSSERPINNGCPQGGVLSAKLFIAYIYDMPENNKINKKQFADDTMFYITHKTPKTTEKILNSFLNQISKYLKNWKLKLNENKSEFVNIIGSAKDVGKKTRFKANNMKIKINNQEIPKKSAIKYLGLNFAYNAQFKNHIDCIIKKTNIANGNLKHLLQSRFLDTKFKTQLYKQIIRPIIEYASPIWANISNLTSYQMERLRINERKILRKTTNSYRKRNEYKYMNSKILYEKANTYRLDRHIVNNACKFYSKCESHENSEINNIANVNDNVNNKKYKPSAYFHYLNKRNCLFEDNKFLLFNKGKYNKDKIVYITNQ